jgi:hypothetical protein
VALLAGGEWGEAKTRLGRFKLCLVRTTYRWEALEWGKSAAEGKFNITRLWEGDGLCRVCVCVCALSGADCEVRKHRWLTDISKLGWEI